MAAKGRKIAKKSAKVAQKRAAGAAPARAAKVAAKRPRPPAGRSRDYLFVGRNQRLLVFHGNTGTAHELGADDTGKVLKLLKQRQKYASEISAHLKKRGFSVATSRIIDSNEA